MIQTVFSCILLLGIAMINARAMVIPDSLLTRGLDCAQGLRNSNQNQAITGLLELLLCTVHGDIRPWDNLWNGPQRRPVQHELLLAAVQTTVQPHSPEDHVVC